MAIHWETLCVDVEDPSLAATFWEQALGWRRTDDGPDEIVLRPPYGDLAGTGPELLFGRVPDAKQVKNRLHLDLRPDDQEAEVRRLEALGARRVDIGQGDVAWVVMADPCGNEFCVLSDRGPH